MEHDATGKHNKSNDEVMAQTMRMLERWVQFSEQHYQPWDIRPQCGHFFGGSYWYGIETAFTAFVYATVYRFADFTKSFSYTDADQIKQKAIGAIRYLGFTHDTGPKDCVRAASSNPHCSERKWGGKGDNFFQASQHGTPISKYGIAALLIWDELDEETQMLVRAVLEDYANKWMDYPCPSGTYTDTQTEENAWTSIGIAAAYFVIKDHPNRQKWEQAMKRWAYNAATTYLDAYRQEKSEGKSLYGGWIKTVTTHPDYTTENHKFVHPNYLSSGIATRAVLGLYYMMQGLEISNAVTYAWEPVYRRAILNWLDHDGTPIPIQGQDWWYYSLPNCQFLHASMNVIGKDADAAVYEKRALDRVEQIQKGTENGCFYEKDGKKFVLNAYQSAFEMEHSAAASIASTYLLHAFSKPEPKKAQTHLDRTGVYHYPYGNTVIRRTKDAFTCFSYRNNVMAFCLPKKGLWSFTPMTANLIGTMTIDTFEGDQGVSNTSAVRHVEKSRIHEADDHFCATVIIDRGLGMVKQTASMIGLPDGSMIYMHRFVANEDVTIGSLHAGIVGIRNENVVSAKEVAKGYRKVMFHDVVKTYKGYMGGEDIVDYFNDIPYVNIDDEMHIALPFHTRVCYRNRHDYPKWTGLEDVLICDASEEPFDVKKGSEFGDFAMVMMPNTDVNQGEYKRDSLKILRAGDNGYMVLFDEMQGVFSFDEQADNLCAVAPLEKTVRIYPGQTWLDGKTCKMKAAIDPLQTRLRKPVITLRHDGAALMCQAHHWKECTIINQDTRASRISIVADDNTEETLIIKPGGYVYVNGESM